MRFRTLLCTAVVALASVGATYGHADVSATGPATTAPATVAGVVDVSGTGGTFTLVQVPAEATLDIGPTEILRNEVPVFPVFRRTGFRAAQISGSGVVQGAVLVSDERPLPPAGKVCAGVPDTECPPMAVLTQVADAEGFDAVAGYNLGFPEKTRTQLLIAPGLYRLYLLGDGGQQKVRLRFDGLPGAAHLATNRTTAGYRNESLTPRLDARTGQRTVQSFGTTVTIPAFSLNVFGLIAGTAPDGQTYTGAETGFCYYLGGAASPEAPAYLPGCPSRFTTPGGVVEIQFPRRFERGLTLVGAGARGAGTESVGGWYAPYGVATRGSAPLLNLDLSGR